MKKALSLILPLLALSCNAPLMEKTSDGVIVRSREANVRLQVISDKIIRVSAVPSSAAFPKDSSLCVVPQGPAPKFNVEDADGMVSLTTSQVKAVVDAKSGAVSFFDASGKKILAEKSRSFAPIIVEGESAYTVRQCFENLYPQEGIYGLGQHQSNEWNYKDRSEALFQYNTKVSVPFVVSTEGYGLLWDSYSLCRWGNPEDCKELSEVFTLYSKGGKEGCLNGTYKNGAERMMREEPNIDFEHLIRGDLNHVVNLPNDYNFYGSNVTYEGFILPKGEVGTYDFSLYYSGYISVEIGGKTVVPTRWRTAWNPNTYKFSVDLQKGEKVPIKISWTPNGSVAYCSLKAYEPRRDKGDLSWWGEMQDQIDYYFVWGPSMDEVIRGNRTLTGKASIMPKWAMGFWQSREKYNTQDEVLSTLGEFRRRHIPIDNIVIDWLHWPQDAWGSHEFDRTRFPDPKAMVDRIHKMNARVMVSVWPKFYASTEHFKEFDSKGWMYQGAIRDSIRDWVGPGYIGSFYDAYSSGARKLFWSQLQDHYVPLGIDAWWMDASEPNIRDCTDIQYRKDLTTPTALGPSTKYFNAYALMNAEAIYDGQRGIDPDRRVFLLTRSGFSGLQRFSTATWSGDIATRWEDMLAQLSAGLNFALSGIPFWTMDIGGFCVEDRYVAAQKLFDETGEENADLKEWRELNTRWYQFGCFVPLFRAHGQWPQREVFNIAPKGHPAYESIVSYIKLRYKLLPYIYSLAGQTYFGDYTLMRPMAMDFTSDETCRDLSDQYMFGQAFLVAPVYRYGQRERTLYLPSDTLWYDFYTSAVVSSEASTSVSSVGSDVIARAQGARGNLPQGFTTVPAPYGQLPLFVRAGSIIPMGGDIEYSAQESSEPLTIMVYAGADGTFTLYDDDGVSYGYEKGEYSRIALTYNDSESTLTLGQRQGSFSGMKSSVSIRLVKVSPDKISSAQTVIYKGEELTVKL